MLISRLSQWYYCFHFILGQYAFFSGKDIVGQIGAHEKFTDPDYASSLAGENATSVSFSVAVRKCCGLSFPGEFLMLGSLFLF